MRFTETLTPHWVALAAEGALRVTAAGCKQHRQREPQQQLGRWRSGRVLTQSSTVDDGGDAAEESGAHLRQSRHGCHQEGVHTHVPQHVLTPPLRLGVVALETRQLRVFGNENQLLGERSKIESKSMNMLEQRSLTNQLVLVY